MNIYLIFQRNDIALIMRIALCIYFGVYRLQYAEEAETFHHCTTTQARANIFSRYLMDTKNNEGVWKNVNYHDSIYFFQYSRRLYSWPYLYKWINC